MPFEHYVGDSTPENNTDFTSNWWAIGDVARSVVEKRHREVAGEDAAGIAARKAQEVIFALDNDDFTGAEMGVKSLCRFLAQYAGAK